MRVLVAGAAAEQLQQRGGKSPTSPCSICSGDRSSPEASLAPTVRVLDVVSRALHSEATHPAPDRVDNGADYSPVNSGMRFSNVALRPSASADSASSLPSLTKPIFSAGA